MERAPLLKKVEARLGKRQLVWFGTRGDDAEAIADVHQFSASFSIINRWARRSAPEGQALEDRTGTRMDLDTYDLDVDDPAQREAKQEFRAQLLSCLARESVVLPYRPTTFLSSIGFARQEHCTMAGLFRDHQMAFEHKPWVESAVARLGVPHVRWTYLADEERDRTTRMIQDGPVLLRRSRTTGGTGLTYLDDPSEIPAKWPSESEAFVSVAPFAAGATPLNVSGVVWHDGITVHPASVQLIGISELTGRRFGYCGNDFTTLGELLTEAQLGSLERTTRSVGEWLRRKGYVGAYGVDLLVIEGVPSFLEVNPRFQGSSRVSCQMAIEAGESCLMLEHLAAHLGIDAPLSRSLQWWAERAAMSHVVVHAPGASGKAIDPTPLLERLRPLAPSLQSDVLTRPDLVTEPGATVCRLVLSGSVTTTGYDLDGRWTEALRAWSIGGDRAETREWGSR